MQKNMPAMIGMADISRPLTTAAEVDVWINRTRRLLKPRPELLADFNYKPPQSVLEGLTRTRTFEPRYKERLDLRVANLIEIVADLRSEDG